MPNADMATTFTGRSLADLVAEQSRPRRLGVALGRLVNRPRLGMLIARATRAPMRLGSASSRVTRLHAWLLRHSGGRLRRSWLFAAGQPVLSLTTTGRRTGRPRTTAVACFSYGDDLVVAAMNLGQPHNPAWALNLTANPQASIVINNQSIRVHARRCHGTEAAQLWQRWVDLQPSATAFRELAGREIPLFVLTHVER
jgi:deazaflavin-dependent oxidoreductase (nitroreductase family)